MGIQIASLYAKIGADTSAFERSMSGVDSKLGAVGGAFGKLGDVIKGVFTVGAGVAAAGIAGLTAEIAKSTSSAADMEQRVADIAAAMNLTSEQTSKVSKLISDLGLDPNLKVSATEAADVIQKLGTAGLSLDTILNGAARSTVQLANATGADFSQAASIASDSMSIFGLKASDLDKSISNILATTQASKFEIGDYAEALAQGGGVASAVGLSFEDFNTTIAAISPLFAGGSDAGTSFKTFLQRLVPQSNEAVDAMRDLGLFTGATQKEFQDAQEQLQKVKDQISKLDPTSKNYAKRLAELQEKQKQYNSVINNGKNAFFDQNGNLKNMAQIAGILQKALGGLSDEQKNSALSTIFGSDAMRAAVAIAQQGEAGFNSLAATMAKTDVGQAMSTRMNTFSGAWEILQGVLESIQITIGNNFLPVFKDMVTWVTNFASANVEPINNFFAGLAGRLAELWIAFKQGGLAGAFADLQKQLSEFSSAVVTWLTQSGILGQIQTTLAGWSGAFANWAIGLWGTYVMPKLTEFWNGLTSWITDENKRKVLVDNLLNWAQQFGAWAGELWNEHIWPKLTETWNSVTSWITDEKKRTELIEKLKGWGQQFAGWAGGLWNEHIWPKLTEMWNSVTSWITDEKKRSELIDKLKDWGRRFGEWAGGLWNEHIWPKLTETWNTLTGWVTDEKKRTELIESLKSWGGKFGEWAGNLWTNTLQPQFKVLWETANQWLKDNGIDTKPWIDAFGKFGDGVLAGWNESLPKMETRWEQFTASMEGKLARLDTAWSNLFGGKGKEGNMAGGLGKFMGTIPWKTLEVLGNMIENMAEQLVQGVEQMGYAMQAWDAIQKGDWGRFAAIIQQSYTSAGVSKTQQMLNNAQLWNALKEADYGKRAAGGPVQAGKAYLVGEPGPEMFVPQSNGTIYNPAQMAGWGGERTLRVVVESPLPTNRQAIRELALALKREIDLTGAVMVG